jgi:hypothetical protein
MPGVILLETNYFIRFGKGFVAYSYSSESSYLEVLKYYDLQLKSNGWKYEKNRIERYWDTDTGRREAIYKKGEYTVSIGYREDEIGQTKFALSFSNSKQD